MKDNEIEILTEEEVSQLSTDETVELVNKYALNRFLGDYSDQALKNRFKFVLKDFYAKHKEKQKEDKRYNDTRGDAKKARILSIVIIGIGLVSLLFVVLTYFKVNTDG